MILMNSVCIVLAVASVFFSYLLLRSLTAKQWFKASRRVVITALFSSLLALSLLSLLYVQSYRQLTWEDEVAQIKVEQINDQHYRVTMTTADNVLSYELRGDEWQLDARVLKWQSWAILSGAQARYRLERLSSRYQDIAQANTQAPTVIALSDASFDHWVAKIPVGYQQWLPWIDTYFGNAVYFPLVDSAQYQVSISQTGLIARPDNEIAETAIKNW